MKQLLLFLSLCSGLFLQAEVIPYDYIFFENSPMKGYYFYTQVDYQSPSWMKNSRLWDGAEPTSGLARERIHMDGDYPENDAFSETAAWYPHRYLAIDQCTIAPMIENHRTGLLWRLFMSCPEIQDGLQKLGFTHK